MKVHLKLNIIRFNQSLNSSDHMKFKLHLVILFMLINYFGSLFLNHNKQLVLVNIEWLTEISFEFDWMLRLFQGNNTYVQECHINSFFQRIVFF